MPIDFQNRFHMQRMRRIIQEAPFHPEQVEEFRLVYKRSGQAKVVPILEPKSVCDMEGGHLPVQEEDGAVCRRCGQMVHSFGTEYEGENQTIIRRD